MTDNMEARKDVLQEMKMKIAAQPINWKQTAEDWFDDDYGFYIAKETNCFSATWGEGDCKDFDSIENAKEWCQQQIDDFFGKYGKVETELFDIPNVEGAKYEIAEAIEQAHMAGQYRDGAGCDPSAYDAMVYRKRIMPDN